jgi:hypothetical protein
LNFISAIQCPLHKQNDPVEFQPNWQVPFVGFEIASEVPCDGMQKPFEFVPYSPVVPNRFEKVGNVAVGSDAMSSRVTPIKIATQTTMPMSSSVGHRAWTLSLWIRGPASQAHAARADGLRRATAFDRCKSKSHTKPRL